MLGHLYALPSYLCTFLILIHTYLPPSFPIPTLSLSLSRLSLSLYFLPPTPLSLSTFSQCHYVLGEHEDDLIDLYGDELSQSEIVNELCYSISGLLIIILIQFHIVCNICVSDAAQC